MKIILLGAPGAGKGSVGKPLSVYLKIPIISTGDIFRENIRNNTELGKMAKDYIEHGKLVPDEVTVALVEDRIENNDCKDGYILDGFPRTVNQADRFGEILRGKGNSIDIVINIELDDNIIVKRLSNRRICGDCGEPYNCVTKKPSREGICDVCKGKIIQRADDEEDTVKRRLNTYYEQTLPLVEYYKEHNLLRVMDNDCSIEEGLLRVLKITEDYKKGN